MNGLWLEDRKLSYRTDIPTPVLGTGDALVQVKLAGICSTDLELCRGYYPYTGVIGHEFVGEIVQAEDDAWLGQRVVGEINIPCGSCFTCRRGLSSHCEQRKVLGITNHDGAFADYLALPVANLHLVPDAVTDEAAVFTEPLAAALEILQQVHISPTDHVLVLGAGRLGQLIAQVLALTGCILGVVARHPLQRDLLATRGILSVKMEDITKRSMDVVVEATGSPDGFALARKLLRPRGKLILKSTYSGKLTTDFSSLVVDEITLVGSRCGPFAAALRLLQNGYVNPLPLITRRYPLVEGVVAMQQATAPETFKILLTP